MTEEPPKDKETEKKPSEIDALRAEFGKQFEEFKKTVQKELESKDKLIAEQKTQIDELNSALVRNTYTDPTPPPKTKEELEKEAYEKDLNTGIELSKKIIKENILG